MITSPATLPFKCKSFIFKVPSALAALLMIFMISGCALLSSFPAETDLLSRLKAFPTSKLPLEKPVTIHWNEHQVPFIYAETDKDAAFTLGMVHAHLRLGQMDLMRHISQGRISELAGPYTIDIDHSLRILNFSRSTEEIESNLPEHTRNWLESFTTGINYYQSNLDTIPHEFDVFGLSPSPWTVSDIITVGRLAATDVSWISWLNIWPLQSRPDWPDLWNSLLKNASTSIVAEAETATDNPQLALLNNLLSGMSRSGSNSLAIDSTRTQSGGALIASDPHLGFMIPNTWILAGIKSPSYHMTGLMIPGLPFIAIGRNRDIAWGGTNLRAASSDLFDVSEIPSNQIIERQEKIKVRWWFDSNVTLRDTTFGPILSDSPLLDSSEKSDVALRWAGHLISDEFSAMLEMNRATNWETFISAFENFSVSAQNMIYADSSGNIGRLMAAQLPTRTKGKPSFIQNPRDGQNAWEKIVGVRQLPMSLNPKDGFIVSANNRPPPAEIPVGYFFSPDDRALRLKSLVENNDSVTIDDLRSVQTDVIEPGAVKIIKAFSAVVERYELRDDLSRDAQKMLQLIEKWDGGYRADTSEPVAFEITLHTFIEEFYIPQLQETGLKAFLSVTDLGKTIPEDLLHISDPRSARALKAGLEKAAGEIDEFPTWGDMHRLRLRHPLGAVPIIGENFTFDEFPSGGSRQTIMKTSHSPTNEKHFVGYGSQARHISDMSDLDENYFVLLGGQDGWLNSSTFLDQVRLWRSREYIKMPLRRDTVLALFPHAILLKPVIE